MEGKVIGSGFRLSTIKSQFDGTLSKFDFNNYAYKNLEAHGIYQNNKFDGSLVVNDEHLKMNFKGLADLSTAIHTYDFQASVEYLDLKKTNLYVRDSTSILTGDFEVAIQGNSFDNAIGEAVFKNIHYQNNSNEYDFEPFSVSSTIDEQERSINVNSSDVLQGYLKGNFSFSEMLPLTQNALGSMYSNYSPYSIADHQYINFNITVYNQLVNALFPTIEIREHATIKGKINSDDNKFKLNVSLPKIAIDENEFSNIFIRTDNQNPLYQTYLSASEIKTDYYDMSKLDLLSKTQNDTLFFKSVFRGGKKSNEKFNLDFYYTIDANKNSVIGFSKIIF